MKTRNVGTVLAVVVALAGCKGSAPTEDSCFFAISHLRSNFQEGQRCTSVLRLDYQTYEPLGVHVACGPLLAIDEATARAQGIRDAAIDETFGQVQQVADASTELFVFFQSPGDFGGVAVVSAATGETLFAGSIVWAGAGDIRYPAAWSSADDLVPRCAAGSAPPAVGVDLVGVEGGVDAESLADVMDVAWSSALARAIEAHGDVHGVTVMLYPRTVGSFNPANAEWIVFVDSGP